MKLLASPYSKRLYNKGLYARYAHRLGVVTAAAAVCGSLVIAGLHDPDRVSQLVADHIGIAAILFAGPAAAGLASGVALALAGRKRRSSGWTGVKPVPSAALLLLDSLAWTLSLLALGAYLLLLVVPPPFVDTPSRIVLYGILIAYWLGATPLASSSLPSPLRWAYFSLVALLLLTLSGRFAIPIEPAHTVWVLQAACYSLLILLGMSWVFARADDLDASHRAEIRGKRDLLQEETRATARRRTNEFVHDHVLSVLTAVATYPTNAPPLQRAAANAQEVLLGRSAEEPLEAVEDLARAIRNRHPEVSVTLHPSAEGYALGGVGPQLYAAAAESISNAVRHGGTPEKPNPLVRVTFRVDGAALVVQVMDNGRGFTREEAEKPGRFGIDHGIYSRMEEAGGIASIDSAPGLGTTVTLKWPGERNGAHLAESTASQLYWRAGLGRSLDTRTAKVYGSVVVAVQLIAIILARSQYTTLVPSLIVLSLFSLLTFGVLLRPWPGARVPTAAAWVTATVVGAGNYLVLNSVQHPSGLGYAIWTLEFGGLIACGLLVRKQGVAAWALVVLLGGTTLAWTVYTGRSPLLALSLVGGNALSLLFWAVLVGWSSKAVFDLTLSDRTLSRIAAQKTMQKDVRAQVTATLRQVSSRAAPLIEPVAAGQPITPQMQLEAKLLEAELRDEIRAASFVNTSVSVAAREARRRGVEVVLLDDGSQGSAPSAIPDRFVERAREVLDATQSGRVVVRIQPEGSAAVGTIVSPAGRDVVT